MTHLIFQSVKEFDEETAPSWLKCDENGWFWDDHIMKLQIGKSIDTDFNNIERVE